jgi:hypothetical protein
VLAYAFSDVRTALLGGWDHAESLTVQVGPSSHFDYTPRSLQAKAEAAKPKSNSDLSKKKNK